MSNILIMNFKYDYFYFALNTFEILNESVKNKVSKFTDS